MVPGRRQSAREGTGPRLSEWPRETQWMRVQVRLRLCSPLASQEVSDVPRLTPHCCCSENPNQESTACPSLTSPSRGRSQQAALVLSLPQSLEPGEGLRGRCGVSSFKPPLTPQGQPVAPPFPACLTESEMHAALAPSRVGKLGYASQVQFSQQLPCSIVITVNGQDSISPF